MSFHWLRQMRRRLTGNSCGRKRAKCLKRRRPGSSENLELRQLMTASAVPAEISEATLAKSPDLPAVSKGAPLLATETTLVGQLQVAKDQDVVNLQAQANQLYRIDLSVTGILGGKVEAKSSDGKTTLAAGTVGSDGRVTLEWKSLKTETISLRVFSSDATAKGGYRLTVDRVIDDVADAAAQAIVLQLTDSFQGRMDHTRDQDWFQVAVKRGDVLRFQLASDNLDGGRLSIFDAAGKTVLRRLDAASSESAQIEWTADRTGAIKLQVTSTTKALGHYTISTERIADDFASVIDQASVLTIAKPVSGSLQFVQDSDWFRFQAVGGKAYSLNWHSDAGVPSEISLYNGKSKAPVATASLQEDGPGLILFKPAVSGDYFIKISRPGTGAITSGFRDVAPNIGYEVSVTRQNFAPVVVAPLKDVVVDEDHSEVTVDLSKTFFDANVEDTLTLTIEDNSNVDLMSATLEKGVLHLKFAANQFGTATLTLRATDPAGLFIETTQNVVVHSVNDTPTVLKPINDIVVDQNADDVVIDLHEHFGDVDVDDVLDYVVIGNSNSNVVGISIEDGQMTVSFAHGRHGDASIQLRAFDGAKAAAETTFAVSVTPPPNTPPYVAKVPDEVHVDEDAEDVTVDLSNVFADDDPDDELRFSLGENTNPGLVTAHLEGDQLRLSFLANQSGTATLTVIATDLAGEQVEIILQITVDPVNDAPVVVHGLDDVKVNEDAAGKVFNLGKVFADPDEGDILQYSVEENSNTDLVTAVIEDGELRLTFAPNGNGEAYLTVRGTDAAGELVETSLKVFVAPVNDAPTVAHQIGDQLMDEDGDDLLINLDQVFVDVDQLWDAQSDELKLQVQVTGTKGSNLVTAEIEDHQLRLHLNPDQHGDAVLTIRATDRAGLSAQTSFHLKVESINDAPTLVGDPTKIGFGKSAGVIVIDLDGVFSDVDLADGSDTLSFTVLDEFGATSDHAFVKDGKLCIQIDGNLSGSETLTVVATDLAGESVELAVSLNVRDSVGISMISGQTALLFADGSLEGGTLAEFTKPDHGTLTRSPSDPNVLIYTPNQGFAGADSFFYRVANADGTFSVGVCSVDVLNLSAPSGVAIPKLGRQTATITWDAALGSPTEYRVDVYERIGGRWQLSGPLSQTVAGDEARQVVLTNLQSTAQYRATVTAVFEDFNQELSANPIDFTTRGYTPPTGLQPANIGAQEITVRWNALNEEGVTAFVVQVRNAAGKVVAEKRVTADVLQATITGLTANTQYSVSLSAEYDSVKLIAGDSIQVKTDQPYLAPSGVVVGDVKYQKGTVTWNDPGWALKGYSVDLERYDTPSATWKAVASQHRWVDAKEARSVTFTGLDANTSYRVTVTAKDAVRNIERAAMPVEFKTADYEAAGSVQVRNVTFHDGQVTWTAPGWNVKGYNVDVEKKVDGAWQRIDSLHKELSANEPLQFNYSKLPSGSHLRIVVTAKNGDLNVERTSMSSEFDTVKVNPPAGVNVINVTSTTATVTWNKGTGPVDQYRVEYREASSSSWQLGGTQPGSQAAQLQVTGLTANTSYVFRVVAVDAVAAETVISLETNPVKTPGLQAPSGVAVSDIRWLRATVTWNKVDWNPDNYLIEVRTGNGTLVLKDKVSGSAAATYDMTGLNYGTGYSVSVTALKNNGAMSSTSDVAVNFQTRTYDAPTNVQVSDVLRMTATVTWTKVEWNAEKYRVEVRANGGSWESKGTKLGTDAARFDLTGLTANTNYEVRITAINANPSLERDSTKSFQTKAFTAPTGLSYTSTYSNVTISWNAVDWNVSSYKTQQKNGDGSWKAVASVGSGTTSYTVTGLTANSTYVFRVVADNANATVPSMELLTTTPRKPDLGAPSPIIKPRR